MGKQRWIDDFIAENYSEPPTKKKYETNKTVVKHTDNICISDLLDMIVYEKKQRYRFNSVVSDNFSKYGWGVPSNK